MEALELALPAPAAPAANYKPFVKTGSLVFISGQVPIGPDGIEFQGRLGRDFSIEEGQAAARLCALNILSQVNAACNGDFSQVKSCVKLGGFVNCTPDFDQHPAVINGASDLVVNVMGEAGQHTRFAVGVSSLPFNVAVEVDAIFDVS
ncbi:MAG: RidA family protein [Parvularculales bacterium]